MAKRSRSRTKAAATPPTPTAPAAPPGARRVTITLSLTFGLGALAALLVPATGPALLGLLVVLGATLGGLRVGRAIGLPRGVAAALAGGIGFALLLAYGAAAGPLPGQAVPALVVAALAALLVVDVVAATPAPLTARAARLAGLGRSRALRVVASVALVALAGRACWVALRTEHDPAFAVALLAALAGVMLWRAPPPRATLLAALLFGLVPAVVALGMGTGFGLWPPITETLAVVVGGTPPRPLLLALASLLAAALAAALAIVTAAPGPPEPAGASPAADPAAT